MSKFTTTTTRSIPANLTIYKFDTTRADGQFRKPASNKKLLDRIGGFQFTPFEEGTLHFSYFCATGS
jgi:hypothetical protein